MNDPITTNCKCGTPVVHPFPPMIPLKHAQGSAIFFPHETGVDCPQCGAHYAPIIVQAQAMFTLVEAVKPVEANKIVGITRPLKAVN